MGGGVNRDASRYGDRRGALERLLRATALEARMPNDARWSRLEFRLTDKLEKHYNSRPTRT